MAVQHTAESNDHADDDHKPVNDFHGGAITTTAAVFSWKLPFQIFTTLLLSLLLPLAFLLIARLSAARYLSTTTAAATAPAIDSFLVSYNCKAVVLYALVSFVTVAALVCGLTAAPLAVGPTSSGRPTVRLYLSWALLCGFQLCVGLGIEGTISAGVDGAAFANQSGNFPAAVIRALLFVGMHETMSFWSRTIVKPVVEDTVGAHGGGRVAAMVEKFGLALSLGSLWWWRLKEEVDALVAVPEMMLAGGGGGDMVVGVAVLVGWWLYYLTVSIGTMRVLKGVIWVGYRVFLVGSATAVACRNHIGEGKSEISNLPLVDDMV